MENKMKKLLVILCVAFLSVAFSSIVTATNHYDEGIDYELIQNPQPTDDASKIEVLEVFWYGCPHCFFFESSIEPWSKNLAKDVVFKRLPAIFNEQWEVGARAYFSAEILNVVEASHGDLFNAIHNEKRVFNTAEKLADFYTAYGIEKDLFLKTYKSFVVNARVARAKSKVPKFGIQGVPAMVVEGKYLITGEMARSYENMLKIADFLVAKERKVRNVQ
jgi:thiol:disulfide interchange protein DsbA